MRKRTNPEDEAPARSASFNDGADSLIVSYPLVAHWFAWCGILPAVFIRLGLRSMPMAPSPFLEQVRTVIRFKHLSYKTEQAYLATIKRFIVFHGKRHPAEMGVPEIRAYLAHLAIERHVAASTQNGALSALLKACKPIRKCVETVGSHLTERFAIARIWVRDVWHFQQRLIRKILPHTVVVFLNLQAGRPPLDLDGLVTV
jgi:hypothetical protein